MVDREHLGSMLDREHLGSMEERERILVDIGQGRTRVNAAIMETVDRLIREGLDALGRVGVEEKADMEGKEATVEAELVEVVAVEAGRQVSVGMEEGAGLQVREVVEVTAETVATAVRITEGMGSGEVMRSGNYAICVVVLTRITAAYARGIHPPGSNHHNVNSSEALLE